MKKILTIIGLAAATLAGANAAVLVSYDFTGATGDQVSQATSSVASNMTGSVLTRGSGLTASAATGSISSTGWTTAASIDLNDYYSFTITPDVGFTLNLDTLTFAERRSGTGIRNFVIRTSLDSFTADIFSASVPDDTATRDQSFTFNSSFDVISSALTIRVYGYSSESAAGTWRLANSTATSNMQLTGTVVPEPQTWALVGIGSAFMIWNLRRRRVQA